MAGLEPGHGGLPVGHTSHIHGEQRPQGPSLRVGKWQSHHYLPSQNHSEIGNYFPMFEEEANLVLRAFSGGRKEWR